jgi:hypothetical protein
LDSLHSGCQSTTPGQKCVERCSVDEGAEIVCDLKVTIS